MAQFTWGVWMENWVTVHRRAENTKGQWWKFKLLSLVPSLDLVNLFLRIHLNIFDFYSFTCAFHHAHKAENKKFKYWK